MPSDQRNDASNTLSTTACRSPEGLGVLTRKAMGLDKYERPKPNEYLSAGVVRPGPMEKKRVAPALIQRLSESTQPVKPLTGAHSEAEAEAAGAATAIAQTKIRSAASDLRRRRISERLYYYRRAAECERKVV